CLFVSFSDPLIANSSPARRSSDLRLHIKPRPIVIRTQSQGSGATQIIKNRHGMRSGGNILIDSNMPCSPKPHRICSRFPAASLRSEEHTSELQSREHLVCRLLLEK